MNPSIRFSGISIASPAIPRRFFFASPLILGIDVAGASGSQGGFVKEFLHPL
jgi:hypothetical protein